MCNFGPDKASRNCRRPAMAKDYKCMAGLNKHRGNSEVETTICKDNQRKRTFSERYLSV